MWNMEEQNKALNLKEEYKKTERPKGIYLVMKGL